MVRDWLNLPQAVPILLRHLGAYAELAAQDLANSRRHLGRQLVAVAIGAIAALFVVMLICAAILAATWDTPNRMAAIYWMIAGFALLAVVAGASAIYRTSSKPKFLESVNREWRRDRVILERILGGHDTVARRHGDEHDRGN